MGAPPVAHLRARLTEADARRLAATLDWPGASASPVARMTSELVWVPFERTCRRALVDRGRRPRHASLALVRQPRPREIVSTPPPDDQGRVLDPCEAGLTVFAPFWILTAADGTRGWVAVEAHAGGVVAGDLAADRSAARWRLAVLMALSLVGTFIGGGVLYTLIHMLVFDLLRLRGPWAMGVPMAAIVLLVWRLEVLLRPGLREPIDRLASGRIRLPLDRSWLGLLRIFGLVFVSLGVVEVVGLFQMTGLSLNVVSVNDDPVVVVGFGLARLVLIYLIVRGALVTSRGKWLPAGPPRAPGARLASPAPRGRVAALAGICLQVTILSMAGMLVGALAWAVGLGWFVGASEAICMTRGAQVGALVALHVGEHLPWGARGALSVGLVAEGVGHTFLPSWLGVGLILILVGLSELPAALRRRQGSAIDALWDAGRAAWALALGAVAGRLVGHLGGLVVFAFFGVGGLVAGQVLGTLLGAAAGYMAQRPQGPEAAAREARLLTGRTTAV